MVIYTLEINATEVIEAAFANCRRFVIDMHPITKSFCQMYDALTNFIRHCFASSFMSIWKKKRKPHHIHHAFIMTAVHIQNAHAATAAFIGLAILVREIYLQRPQDRGSDDSSSNGYFNYAALLTI